MFSETFKALLKEAQFTREMLGSGATQIRRANYATKGRYFQAFTSLSTGLERIGKLCLLLDYFNDHNGDFPSLNYMRREIGHDITVIYTKSTSMIAKYSVSMTFLQNLNDPIHRAILSVLSEFALGDRYSNINLLVGDSRQNDPVAAWFEQVDKPLFATCVTQREKVTIQKNAATIASVFGPHARSLHISETGRELTDLEEASHMTGMYETVARHRQLYVLQIIRYWTELLSSMEDHARKTGSPDIPFFSEIFAPFYNDDSYMRTRKNWEKL